MKNILYLIANDNNRNFITAADAKTGEEYFCCACNGKMHLEENQSVLRFIHNSSDVNCDPKIALRISFKNLLHKKIEACLNGGDRLTMRWKCNSCNNPHEMSFYGWKGTQVRLDHMIGACKTDVVLLNRTDEIVLAIDIITDSKLKNKTPQYYKENDTAYTQFFLNSEKTLKILDKKRLVPSFISVCLQPPECTQCGNNMEMHHVDICSVMCYECGAPMQLASLEEDRSGYLNKDDVEFARSKGAIIEKRTFSAGTMYVNVCKKCNSLIGPLHLGEYFSEGYDEYEFGYYCPECSESVSE
ncbi:MAG: hypothetical protein WC178_02630 [Candidatus Paceibacterota bacterium]